MIVIKGKVFYALVACRYHPYDLISMDSLFIYYNYAKLSIMSYVKLSYTI